MRRLLTQVQDVTLCVREATMVRRALSTGMKNPGGITQDAKVHQASVRSSVLDLCSMRQQTALAELTTSSAVNEPAHSNQTDVTLLQAELLRQGQRVPVASSSPSADTFGTVLEGRLLESVDLSSANISASFNRANLNKSCLDGVTFNRCTFHLTALQRATSVDARWLHCSFLGSTLNGLDARMTRFLNCTFHRCDMTSWRCEGASFSGCTFYKCNMDGWTFDSQTTFANYTAPKSSSQHGWVQSKESLQRFGPQDVTILLSTSNQGSSSMRNY
jgi:uncharacterized protein YjbI with pentapeptide repeats